MVSINNPVGRQELRSIKELAGEIIQSRRYTKPLSGRHLAWVVPNRMAQKRARLTQGISICREQI